MAVVLGRVVFISVVFVEFSGVALVNGCTVILCEVVFGNKVGVASCVVLVGYTVEFCDSGIALVRVVLNEM